MSTGDWLLALHVSIAQFKAPDPTRQSSLVWSGWAVWIGFATTSDCRRQEIGSSNVTTDKPSRWTAATLPEPNFSTFQQTVSDCCRLSSHRANATQRATRQFRKPTRWQFCRVARAVWIGHMANCGQKLGYKIYVYDKQFVLGVYCFAWQRVGPILALVWAYFSCLVSFCSRHWQSWVMIIITVNYYSSVRNILTR